MHWLWHSTKGATRPDKQRRFRPELQALEDRLVPSLMGSASAVSPLPRGYTQVMSANASSLHGDRTVIVFTRTDLAGHNKAIFADVYDASGNRILPFAGIPGLDNLPVATDSQYTIPNTNIVDHVLIGNPAVAMDPAGDFVVTWSRVDVAASVTDIMVQHFSANGLPLGQAFCVDSVSGGAVAPKVAMDGQGNFVVAHTGRGAVQAEMRDANGRYVRTVTLPLLSGRREDDVSVSMAPDGRFAIALVQDGRVRVDRFGSQGLDLSSDFVDSSGAIQAKPSISMDTSGNCVVGWVGLTSGNSAVRARRLSSAGVLGSVMNLGEGFQVSVAIDPIGASATAGGNFVVASTHNTVDPIFGTSSPTVSILEVTNNDTQVRTIFNVTSRSGPSVSINANHRYLVTWTNERVTGDNTIFQQYGTLQDVPPPMNLPPTGTGSGSGGSSSGSGGYWNDPSNYHGQMWL